MKENNKERYNQIIDEAYALFFSEASMIKEAYECGDILGSQPYIDAMFSNPEQLVILDKDEFVNLVKTHYRFNEEWKKWGLEIEERELEWKERIQWVMKNTDVEWENLYITEEVYKPTTPTKLVTLKYKGETIESYA
jgi:hypothetical protein